MLMLLVQINTQCHSFNFTVGFGKHIFFIVFGQIVATGVCHTDLYHLFESMHKDGFPAVLGHEGAGIVESVGPGVTEFKTGQLKRTASTTLICPPACVFFSIGRFGRNVIINTKAYFWTINCF